MDGLLLAGASVKVAVGAGLGDRGSVGLTLLQNAGTGAARTEQEGTAVLVPALMLPEVWRDSCCMLLQISGTCSALDELDRCGKTYCRLAILFCASNACQMYLHMQDMMYLHIKQSKKRFIKRSASKKQREMRLKAHCEPPHTKACINTEQQDVCEAQQS